MAHRRTNSEDDEATPLIGRTDDEPQSLGDRILALTKEPLTDLTKLLLAVVVILLLATATFIGLFAGAEHKLSHRPASPVPTTSTVHHTATVTSTVHSEPTPTACYTPECIMLSSDILSGMDQSVDPCENFYDYVNGGWLQHHPLPADKSIIGAFTELAKDNKAIIRELVNLDDGDLSSADAESLNKIKTLYNSCTDETTLNDVGSEPLKALVATLRDILHGKDVGSLDSETRQAHFTTAGPEVGKHPWTGAVAFAHSRGIAALFDFAIEGDAGADPDHMVPWFNQPSLGLPSKEYYLEEELTEKYKEVLERLLLALDDDETKEKSKHERTVRSWPPWPWPPWGDDDQPENSTTRAKRLATEVFDFESAIASASADNDFFNNPFATYNPVNLTNLSSAVPQIAFPAYFATFAVRKFPATSIILAYPPYAKSLGELLANTTTETFGAYLVVRAALTYAPYLSYETEEWKAVRELREVVYGLKKGAVTERSEWCFDQVERELGYSVGRFYVQKAFGGDSREKGTQIIKDIIGAFKESLFNLEWMDKYDAKLAAEKADNLEIKVGAPLWPDTWNDRAIAAYYSTTPLHADTFFNNIVQTILLRERTGWSLFGQQRDRRRWEMFASTVNAYFEPPANEIVFPAGILQPPFFSAKFPQYLNYGGFGMVAAHELTHAFDSAGRLYNQNGQLEEWWSNSTSAAFDERARCLADQYSGYTVDDGKGHRIAVNGNLTSGENIGDTGLIQAWRAWQAQYDQSFAKGDEYLLPGLNLTREQLFFVSFGRVWAQNISPAAALQRIRTDPHSPNRFRVDGTVYNVPEFAKAFNCPKGAKLNPRRKERCSFW